MRVTRALKLCRLYSAFIFRNASVPLTDPNGRPQELHKKAQQGGGDDPVLRPREPLEVQLETLALWYTTVANRLRSFKSRFRSMGCSVLASADKEVFQVRDNDCWAFE